MANIYFSADSHFSHTNMARGVSRWEKGHRDFDTVEEMNIALVDRINEKVKADDTFYHLGDWSFGGYDQIKIFRDQLNCKNIHLILGNHDENIMKHFAETKSLFSSISFYREIKLNGVHFVMFHYPIGEWHKKYKGSIHLHGHSHGNYKQVIDKPRILRMLEEGKIEELKAMCKDDDYSTKYMDVGACTNNLYPYSIEEVIEITNKKTLLTNWI